MLPTLKSAATLCSCTYSLTACQTTGYGVDYVTHSPGAQPVCSQVGAFEQGKHTKGRGRASGKAAEWFLVGLKLSLWVEKWDTLETVERRMNGDWGHTVYSRLDAQLSAAPKRAVSMAGWAVGLRHSSCYLLNFYPSCNTLSTVFLKQILLHVIGSLWRACFIFSWYLSLSLCMFMCTDLTSLYQSIPWTARGFNVTWEVFVTL